MIAKVRAPTGFKFKIHKIQYGDKRKSFYVSVNLYNSEGKYIGDVELVQKNNRKLETHSYLKPEYHNKGLGTLLYARAIQWALEHGYKVSSSGESSREAQRVWKSKSLRKFFKIKKEIPHRNRSYVIFLDAPEQVDDYAMWRAYPKE